jgi:hypothetical protein
MLLAALGCLIPVLCGGLGFVLMLFFGASPAYLVGEAVEEMRNNEAAGVNSDIRDEALQKAMTAPASPELPMLEQDGGSTGRGRGPSRKTQ